jgi:hypothetical protein
MVLCPIAVAVGCRKCPVFNVCPAKAIIGDYKPDESAQTTKETSSSDGARKKQ